MTNRRSHSKHRLYVDEPLAVDTQITLPIEATHYLLRVLRLRDGAAITLFNGDGYNYLAQVNKPQGKQLVLDVAARETGPVRATPLLVLALPLLKGERMDYALQKATELGVDQVHLFLAARSDVKLTGDRLVKRLLHWQRVVRSASEQSGRTRLPELLPAVTFEEMLKATAEMNRYVFEPTADAGTIEPSELPICSIVGPEGGFEERELNQLEQHCTLLSFGDLTLRAETAPVVALTLANLVRGKLA